MGRRKELQAEDKQFYDATIESVQALTPVTLETARQVGRIAGQYWFDQIRHGGSYYRNKNPKTAANRARIRADELIDGVVSESDDLITMASQLARGFHELHEQKSELERPSRIRAEWQAMSPSLEELLYLLFGREVDVVPALTRRLGASFIPLLMKNGPSDVAVVDEAQRLGLDMEGVEIVHGILEAPSKKSKPTR